MLGGGEAQAEAGSRAEAERRPGMSEKVGNCIPIVYLLFIFGGAKRLTESMEKCYNVEDKGVIGTRAIKSTTGLLVLALFETMRLIRRGG